MATKGWENATLNDVRDRRQPVKRSKYRNVKTVIGSEVFDSKREAAYWQGLKAREKNGEITKIQRQVPYALCAPDRTDAEQNRNIIVAWYISDFLYTDREGQQHVVDAKGYRTTVYQLKKKWLFVQDGIVIEEV